MAIGQIPPWIAAIDPLAPVANYLQGYRTGVSERESETAANLRAQQMFLAAQEAAQMAQLRQQQQELDAAQFNARLRLDEQKAEREAKAAAQQMEGQLGIQADLAAGVAWPQALVKWAPKLFAGEPAALARSMGDIVPPQPPTFGTTPEGVRYMQSPTGGTTLVPPSYSREPFTPRTVKLGEGEDAVDLVETSAGHFQVVGKPPVEGNLTREQIEKLRDIRTKEGALRRELQQFPAAMQAKNPQLKAKADELAALEKQREAIYRPPTAKAPEGQKSLSDKQQDLIRKAREKIERISKGMPPGRAQAEAIRQVMEILRREGITVPEAPAAAPQSGAEILSSRLPTAF